MLPLPDLTDAVDAVCAHLATTAVERDRAGGHAAREREAIRASGLLALSVPVAHGGTGAGWARVLGVVRAMAEVDSALAHVFAFHHLQVATVLLYGDAAQAERLLGDTVRDRLWWGNALNPLDTRMKLRDEAGRLTLDGAKSFCSGARGSDLLTVSALRSDGSLAVAAIPTRREGVTVLHDWDNMGQRQTDSGTVELANVAVEPRELLRSPGPEAPLRFTLRACLAQSILCNLYAGIARGALTQARAFVQTEVRPWHASGVQSVLSDPYQLHRFAELHLATRTAELFTERAALALDAAWALGDALTVRDRGELALAIVEAKVAGTRAALDVTSRIFEALGARATAARFGFDRFWRNARTHTLHDPLDYKLRDLGDYALTGALPEPSLYG